jgi:chloramphenicol-sensitive protein RarD
VGNPEDSQGSGLAYGLAAYGMWGLVPLYIWAMESVPPAEILAHRIVWCSIILLFLLTIWRRWGAWAHAARNGRTLTLLTCSSLLIAGNWFLYIYAANSGETIQASLGYFINPLFSVLLGMVVFGERLRVIQWLAIALAALGVVVLIIVAQQLPWIALCLAFTFGMYGLVRKLAPVDALVGLSIETLLLVPVAVVCIFVWTAGAGGSFGQKGLAVDGLLLGTGAITALPLLCFGQAARRLPLTTLGILQYIAPTLQFLLAVLVRGEPFQLGKAVSFGFIWTGLAVFSVESLLRARRRRPITTILRAS